MPSCRKSIGVTNFAADSRVRPRRMNQLLISSTSHGVVESMSGGTPTGSPATTLSSSRLHRGRVAPQSLQPGLAAAAMIA